MIIDELKTRLDEARILLREATERYIIEEDPKLWTSRVREWLKNDTR